MLRTTLSEDTEPFLSNALSADDIESQTTIVDPCSSVSQPETENPFQFDQSTLVKEKALRRGIQLLQGVLQEKTFKNTLRERILFYIKNSLLFSSMSGFGYFTYDLINRYLLNDALLKDWKESLVSDNRSTATCAEFNNFVPHIGDLYFCSDQDAYFPDACATLAKTLCDQASENLLQSESISYGIAGFFFLGCLISLIYIWKNYAHKDFDLSHLKLIEFLNDNELAEIKGIANQYLIVDYDYLDYASIKNALGKFKNAYEQDPEISNYRNRVKINSFANRLFFIASNVGPYVPDKPALPTLPPELYFKIFQQGVGEEIQALVESEQLKELSENEAEEAGKGKEKEVGQESQTVTFSRFSSTLFSQGFKKYEANGSPAVDNQAIPTLT